jgi:hypothetical protein
MRHAVRSAMRGIRCNEASLTACELGFVGPE